MERLGGAPGQERSFLADGRRLVGRALNAHAPVEQVFYRPPLDDDAQSKVVKRVKDLGIPCHAVTKSVFFHILGLGYETNSRVLALVAAQPLDGDAVVDLVDESSVLMLGENIQDPRNVGVLLRTADALKLTAVVLDAASAPPYSRAAVRSSTGSAFAVPIAIVRDTVEIIDRLKAKGVRVLGASAKAPETCWDADLTGPCAIVLGNESDGLTAQAAEHCSACVKIPMLGGASSFNVTVAAGILFYEVIRQRQAGQDALP